MNIKTLMHQAATQARLNGHVVEWGDLMRLPGTRNAPTCCRGTCRKCGAEVYCDEAPPVWRGQRIEPVTGAAVSKPCTA